MKEDLNLDSVFAREFIASSRLNAIESVGEEGVDLMDEEILGFVEGEDKHDPEAVLGFLSETFHEEEKLTYSIISYAKERASKDMTNSEDEVLLRTLEIVSELNNLRQVNDSE